MNESYEARLRSVGQTERLSPVANKRANINFRRLSDYWWTNCQLFIAVLVTKSERSNRHSTGAPGCRHRISSVRRWQYPNSISHRNLLLSLYLLESRCTCTTPL